MVPAAQQPVSTTVFSIGAACGLLGGVAAAGALLGVSADQSRLAIWLGWPSVLLFSPACLVALWHRRAIGMFFVLSSAAWTASVFLQRSFQASHDLPVRSLTRELESLTFSLIFLGYGAFALLLREDHGQLYSAKSERNARSSA